MYTLLLTFFKNPKIIGGVFVGVALVFGVIYVKTLTTNLKLLETENQILNSSLVSHEKQLQKVKKNIEEIKTEFGNYVILTNKNRTIISDLSKRFSETKSGNQRNFGELAENKPELIQNAINKGTNELNRCFEIISGGKLEGDETNDTISKCSEK